MWNTVIKVVVLVAVLVNITAMYQEMEILTKTVAAYDSDVELAESAVQATQLSNEYLLAGYGPLANIFIHGMLAIIIPLMYIVGHAGLSRKETITAETSSSVGV